MISMVWLSEVYSQPFPSFWRSPACIPWLMPPSSIFRTSAGRLQISLTLSDFCFQSHMAFSGSPLPASLLDELYHEAHLDKPGPSPHLSILDITTPAKSLLLCKVTCWLMLRIGTLDIWWRVS